MKLKEFLSDRRYLILFYIFLMAFITAVIYLDPAVKVWSDNIIYINVVSTFLFVIYLLAGYFSRRKYYQDINEIIREKKEELIYHLPASRNHEQSMYRDLLINIYQEQNARIEKLHEEKKDNFEFISSWVHEVKTPIAVIRLIMESSRESLSEEIVKSLEEEVDRIDSLVEQTLYYSKIDDFSRDYFINEFKMEVLVKEVIKKHAKTFINKNIRIEMNGLDHNITTDKKWFIFIMDQVLSNALKYTDEGGIITVSAQKEEDEKRLIITDNGIGIRPEDIDRVFDRGFTGYNGREYQKSTGMGLYLAKRLARKLGHDISMESVYGEYSRVIIHFPKLIDYYDVTKI